MTLVPDGMLDCVSSNLASNIFIVRELFPYKVFLKNALRYGDQNADTFHDPNWTESGSDWLRVVPWGFRNVLNWIKDTYNNPPVVVTENGYSDLPGVRLNDQGRIQYYTGYINNLLKAVLMDGCNVRAYSCWSLMDDFEWASGYA